MVGSEQYTLEQVVQFFEYAQSRGLMNPHSARASRAVLTRVGSVLDLDEQNKLATLNWDEIFVRFKNKHAQELSADSLRVYKSRFLSALETFLRYQAQPQSFKATKPLKGPKAEVVVAKSPAGLGAREVLPDIPVPLESGVVVKIVGLPRDLSRQEAERFQRIINSYIV